MNDKGGVKETQHKSNGTASSLMWDFSGTILKSIGLFSISVVLARLLLPSVFGVMAIALVLVNLSGIFIEGGFSRAIIQGQYKSVFVLNSVFWMNLLVGILIAVLVFGLSGFVAQWFEMPDLSLVLKLIAPIFIINSLTVVHGAVLQQALRFKTLSLNQLLASIGGGLVAVVLALLDFGVISLVVQQLITASLLLLLYSYSSSFRPGLYLSVVRLRILSRFGSYVFFSGLGQKLYKQIDVLMIGRLFEPGVLGLYSRALSLQTMISTYSSSSFQRVFFPLFSKLYNEKSQFEPVFLKAMSVVSYVAFALSGIAYLSASKVIPWIYGASWEGVVPFFKLLALTAYAFPLNVLIVSAFNGSGRSKMNFWIGNLRKGIGLVSFLFLYAYGIEAFLWSVVAISLLVTFMNFIFVARILKVPFLEELKSVAFPGVTFFTFIAAVKYLGLEAELNALVLTTMFIGTYVVLNALFKFRGSNHLWTTVHNLIQERLALFKKG
ncbi:MAG: lipopolysaccharide biosynthesis protein [Cryomorphaceae bacterium]